jgi:hypothetical protein
MGLFLKNASQDRWLLVATSKEIIYCEDKDKKMTPDKKLHNFTVNKVVDP